MKTTPPLDIKVVYSESSLGRRRKRTSRTRGTIQRSRLVLLGLMNLAVAGGLYYATWWWADPELRVRLIMHTELPGVDADAAAGMLVPSRPPSPRTQPPATVEKTPITAGHVTGPSAQAILFVSTIIGWELLSTLAACAVALSAGALLGRGKDTMFRLGGALIGVAVLGALGWAIHALWAQYGRFVPDQLRIGVGALVVATVVSGLVISRRAKGLTYLAAIVLILSAAGSALGLYVGTRCDAITPEELPVQLSTFLALVFGIHSLWGWILLPIAWRIRR